MRKVVHPPRTPQKLHPLKHKVKFSRVDKNTHYPGKEAYVEIHGVFVV